MKSTFSFIKDGGWLTMTLAVVIGVFAVVSLVQAATTISTNISTDGTLSVTGASTLSSTLTVSGLTSLGNASSTRFSVFNTAYFGGTATSTFSSTGALTLIADLTLQNGEVISNSTNGTVSIGGTGDIIKILGTASTSALKVGDETAASTINGMAFGYCNIPSTTVNATSTAYAICSAATGVETNDRVWVMATSSIPAGIIVGAASSTAQSTISLLLVNVNTGANTATGAISLNFWAVR